jgi:hypothetical protein
LRGIKQIDLCILSRNFFLMRASSKISYRLPADIGRTKSIYVKKEAKPVGPMVVPAFAKVTAGKL